MASDFGQTLQALMDERRVSGRELAAAISVSYKTIQEWLGAKSRMPRDPEALRRLAEHFGCSVHYLLFGEEDPHSLVGEILEKTEIHTGLYEITVRRVKNRGGQR